MPEVGTNSILEYGPVSSLIVLTPPKSSAGKNLKVRSPSFSPCSISVAVTAPGRREISSSWQAFTTSSLSPGATQSSAPASFAICTCSGDRIVPAATVISGSSFLIARMQSSAHSFLNVTSI